VQTPIEKPLRLSAKILRHEFGSKPQNPKVRRSQTNAPANSRPGFFFPTAASGGGPASGKRLDGQIAKLRGRARAAK